MRIDLFIPTQRRWLRYKRFWPVPLETGSALPNPEGMMPQHGFFLVLKHFHLTSPQQTTTTAQPVRNDYEDHEHIRTGPTRPSTNGDHSRREGEIVVMPYNHLRH